MLSFSIGRTAVRLEFSFFAVSAILMAIDETGTATLGITACLIHEAAHIAAMLLRGRKPERIRFYCGGIKAVSVSCCNDFVVLAAGCAANFALFLLIYPFCISGDAAVFAVVNLLVGIINLLPFGTLDGGRILEGLVLRAFSPERASSILRVFESVTGALLITSALLLLLSGYLSPLVLPVFVLSALDNLIGGAA